MFTSPGAIAFNLFSIDVHWYGIIMSCAILFSIVIMLLVRKRYFSDITIDSILDILFVLIVFGIFFARLYYVILDFSYFSKYPLEIPAVWNGGISIQGAVIGGILGGLIYTKLNKLNFLRYADLFSFGLIFGQFIGRWGNFFNSEAFGLPCNLPWKLYIPFYARPVEYRVYEYFHPTFLYESILDLLVFIILFIFLRSFTKRRDGLIFFSYLILYSIVRFIVETIRVDSVLNVGGFHIAHIASVLFIVFGIIGILLLKNAKSDT